MKDLRQRKVWEKSHQLTLARDLSFLPKDSYEKLRAEVEEAKPRLTSLLKTIYPDRWLQFTS